MNWDIELRLNAPDGISVITKLICVQCVLPNYKSILKHRIQTLQNIKFASRREFVLKNNLFTIYWENTKVLHEEI